MIEWRIIPDHRNYEACSNGQIRRCVPGVNTYPGRLRKLQLNPTNGYLQVSLYYNGQESRCWVHRLIAVAFLGPCPDGFQVNHKNGNRTDNRIENLEYVTPQENIYDKARRKQIELTKAVRRWRTKET